jgi:hypothetical protein
MNESLVQQHPLLFPKIGLPMSFSWVLGNFASHGICGARMMKFGWVFVVLVLLADWISVVLLQANWVSTVCLM